MHALTVWLDGLSYGTIGATFVLLAFAVYAIGDFQRRRRMKRLYQQQLDAYRRRMFEAPVCSEHRLCQACYAQRVQTLGGVASQADWEQVM